MGIAWVVVVLVLVAAGALYLTTRPSRYREHADGLLRTDRETGRKHIFVNGRWQPAPEVDRAQLQAKLEAQRAEQLERQLAAPLFVLPPVGTEPPGAQPKN